MDHILDVSVPNYAILRFFEQLRMLLFSQEKFESSEDESARLDYLNDIDLLGQALARKFNLV